MFLVPVAKIPSSGGGCNAQPSALWWGVEGSATTRHVSHRDVRHVLMESSFPFDLLHSSAYIWMFLSGCFYLDASIRMFLFEYFYPDVSIRMFLMLYGLSFLYS